MTAVPLTEDQEFRLIDLYTSPVDNPPKRWSTMAGYIYHELWDLWDLGLIHRVSRGGIRVTQLGEESLGV